MASNKNLQLAVQITEIPANFCHNTCWKWSTGTELSCGKCHLVYFVVVLLSLRALFWNPESGSGLVGFQLISGRKWTNHTTVVEHVADPEPHSGFGVLREASASPSFPPPQLGPAQDSCHFRMSARWPCRCATWISLPDFLRVNFLRVNFLRGPLLLERTGSIISSQEFRFKSRASKIRFPEFGPIFGFRRYTIPCAEICPWQNGLFFSYWHTDREAGGEIDFPVRSLKP